MCMHAIGLLQKRFTLVAAGATRLAPGVSCRAPDTEVFSRSRTL
jgi:hypothetical protein